ncbi:MAG: hypothetical protein QM656_03655 [Paracoccaceae bacterium]
MAEAQAALLTDGRLHLNHRQIDMINGAWGDTAPVRGGQEPVARTMAAAVAPFRPAFIAPITAAVPR